MLCTRNYNNIKTLQIANFSKEQEEKQNIEKFIEENRNNIVKYANKFIPFSPYGLEDFLQEAFIVAIEIERKKKARKKPFSMVFWGELAHAYSKIAQRKPPIPLDEKNEEKIPDSKKKQLEFGEFEKQEKDPQLLLCFLIVIEKIRLAMDKMSEKQKEVCQIALSYNKKCKTQEEFTRLFSEITNRKISRRAVMRLIDRGCDRIKKNSNTESQIQTKVYHTFVNLIPEISGMLNEKKITQKVARQLSHLSAEDQKTAYSILTSEIVKQSGNKVKEYRLKIREKNNQIFKQQDQIRKLQKQVILLSGTESEIKKIIREEQNTEEFKEIKHENKILKMQVEDSNKKIEAVRREKEDALEIMRNTLRVKEKEISQVIEENRELKGKLEVPAFYEVPSEKPSGSIVQYYRSQPLNPKPIIKGADYGK